MGWDEGLTGDGRQGGEEDETGLQQVAMCLDGN